MYTCLVRTCKMFGKRMGVADTHDDEHGRWCKGCGEDVSTFAFAKREGLLR